MNLCFQCPECQQWTTTAQVGAGAWPCAACGISVTAAAPAETLELTHCRRCGNHELYVQKDFSHRLGMGIIVVACIASVFTLAKYWILATWMILLGSAVLDVVLYLLVGNVTLCYRCQTQYRGFPPNPQHQPFVLATGEKYRQERIRSEQLSEDDKARRLEGDKVTR